MYKFNFICNLTTNKNRIYNRLKRKGIIVIEFALILAFILATGIVFTGSSFSNSINTIITKVDYAFEGKNGIFTSDDFFTALQKSNVPIVYNGKPYNTIYDYIKDKVINENYSFTSGSIEAGWNNGVDSVYNNGSDPVHDALTKSKYAGHENITWSIINGTLYVYDKGKLNLKDNKGQKFTVDCYDIRNPNNKLAPKTVTFVQSSNGYGYLKP